MKPSKTWVPNIAPAHIPGGNIVDGRLLLNWDCCRVWGDAVLEVEPRVSYMLKGTCFFH